jgi:20S proteasome alpha/beta subunit
LQYRNTYDSDNTIFSPQGRLHQVEYALEAVKQGSAAVGLRSKTHTILLALKVREPTLLHGFDQAPTLRRSWRL